MTLLGDGRSPRCTTDAACDRQTVFQSTDRVELAESCARSSGSGNKDDGNSGRYDSANSRSSNQYILGMRFDVEIKQSMQRVRHAFRPHCRL